MKFNFDLNKTLQELEDSDWGEPTFDSSLVVNCHRLRRVPLKDFSVGNLRLMIGQQISLDYLIPLALERLADDPFVEGDYYEGDLLKNVLRVSKAFWEQHSDLHQQLIGILKEASQQINALDPGVRAEAEIIQLAKSLLDE